MLVLTRKNDQEIRIAGNIVIVVKQIQGNRVSLGIDAPKEMPIVRGELQSRPGGARTSKCFP